MDTSSEMACRVLDLPLQKTMWLMTNVLSRNSLWGIFHGCHLGILFL